ncbi:MAG: DegT/DnrJ/EryC1/StrS family aminotransferase, partial [Flavobacteriaceae bacterium]
KGLNKKNLKEKHWFYQVKDLGFKYNMNDLMAAIGIVQLKKLNSFSEKNSHRAFVSVLVDNVRLIDNILLN